MRRYVLAMTAAFIIVAPFAMSTWGDSQAQEQSTKAQEKEAKKAQEKEAKAKEKAAAQEKTAPAQEKTAPAQEKEQAAPTQGQATTGDVEAGRGLYGVHCKKCHGDQGQGNPRMYRLVKATIVHLGSTAAQAKTDVEIRKSMTHGFGKMEAVKELNAAQVENILAFTRTLRQ